MTAIIIDGKAIAQQTRLALKRRLNQRRKQNLITPGLAVVLVGEDAASKIYVRNKRDACRDIGIHSMAYDLVQHTTELELLHLITTLNADQKVHGILIQLPLPASINTGRILDSIDPKKDVDGFHPTNLGLLAQGRPFLRPCTPYGVMRLLAYEKIQLKGLNAVIVGTSNIVGKPLALELLNAGCTITLCHSATRNLHTHIRQADVLVSAIGKAGIIQSPWIKPGAIVIDIGITRTPSGKLHGDIEFSSAKEIAGYITPVPGGVGPMTVAMLLENTLFAAECQDIE
ncbi:bifunctional methylenetetrahydrofolate dehydrogenase/methenyltetrahydrofolate cyclohydrolase FolD [Rickettsiella endosymbiont of Litargus connexus]|jgi:methylenetetrahydrofolate dehydrogenase (NADP+)/methenyltetrahydrofolate cyclohydrolase|uniref:bifunctional methylenetetrahydrofolate dehydrogenase/methenyltetrahydrofolate cyclohydrolase FolD n=1 Tax=Rickettsiella endosymbiont of Litargus connexus TaxID=3066237 RepID=UPI0027F95498|nr:bifunctional methylenetetrahydrofolate dehydrogenase/methenyltetrahydrofolate cyclohydrolase FolD [Gammaproteobacteria bacterium]MCH9754765.1 bifunctional methylenetetrahydrofolate dehydrogenase/methenyltetrahydrofolate cyclohydrolase FolD [Gammaproteobacteria bacterium]MDD4893054.1 bifunctional methylenetetrahydrofolate dehydrogenase/methenyltetrahydrofolate cyclohydrolase FolD [Candidatus Rickettsiella isopodorum]MDD5161987.1 bifunctional methylenetetrahydrofolate dehydrogenase/methenyltetr